MQGSQGDNATILQGISMALAQISQWMDRLENLPGCKVGAPSVGKGSSANTAMQDGDMCSNRDG